MSLEKAKAYLESKGFLDHVIELKDSTAVSYTHLTLPTTPYV